MWNWLTGFDSENSQRAADADAQLQELNRRDYGPGGKLYTPENADTVASNRKKEIASTGGYGVENNQAAIKGVFYSSLSETAENIFGKPLEGVRMIIAAILKAVPWWLWLAGAVALFAWLGGFAWLKGILARVKKSV